MEPHAIAIDLGGTHAAVGVVRENVLLASRDIAVDAPQSLAPLLPVLEAAIRSLMKERHLRIEESLGISLSLPSLVDFAACRVVSTNDKYPDATTLDLQGWAKNTFGLSLVLENDARAALVGEAVAGAAQGFRDVLMITLGTGVGSAVLVAAKPFRTSQPQGGNLGGHIPVRIDGRQCTCGAVGCVESEASGWALPLVAKQMADFAGSKLAAAAAVDFATVFALSDAGDGLSQRLVEHCIRVWSMGIVGLVHTYGPQLVVVGGGVSKRADLLPAIAKYVHKHAWTPSGPVQFATASLGNEAPLYAAVSLLQLFHEKSSTDS